MTISKKQRILCNIILILLILGAVDFFAGTSFLLPEVQFRREERAKLLGPATILGTEEIDYDRYQRLIIADAGDGVILWVCGEGIDQSGLAYREKTGENVLMAPSGTVGYLGAMKELHLPLVLFDNQPRAVGAQICFTLTTNYNGEDFEKFYMLSAERTAAGYFLFTLDAYAEGNAWRLDAEGRAIQYFANVSANLEKSPNYAVPVEIRFYDAAGQLIGEEEITVCSEAALYQTE